MNELREDVGEIIGQYIPEGQWEETFTELNTQGWIDTKTTQKIIVELCKRVEQLEGHGTRS